MKFFNKFLVLAVVFSVLVSYTPAQDVKDKKIEKEIKNLEKYLVEAMKHFENSSVYSERFDEKQFISAGAKGIIEGLKQKDVIKIADETRDHFLKSLKGAKFENLNEFLNELKGIIYDVNDFDLKLVQTLGDFAVRGMLKKLGDPYCMLLTAEDIQKLLRMLTGEARDESLGISVQPEPDGTYKIAYVMYGYAAYDAGLSIGDIILEINGKSVKEMTIKEITQLLQVKPGNSIELEVKKYEYNKVYKYVIEQKTKKPKDVIYAIMPGKIGYLRLTIFDLFLTSEVTKALKHFKKNKVRALILDLRNNPGGALPAATSTADLFIEDGKFITYTETKLKLEGIFGVFGMKPEEVIKAKKKSDFENIPMVVLTNHESASASELLAGALQDLNRAIIVGEKTFGKGVGQSPIPLVSTSKGLLPSRFLYLTVLKYYLPTGRSIDGVGVEPDILVPETKSSAKDFDIIWNLKDKFHEYVEENYAYHKETLLKLAEYDSFDNKSYPNFEKWKKSLNVKISDDILRRELRIYIRKYLEKKEGISFVYDLVDDIQLQRALKEVLATIKE